jgi:tetratricopeptide (TPR) repeat protein
MTLRPPARTSPALAGLVLCVALALGGCATAPQMAALERAWPSAWPDQVLLATVPFFAQDDHLCGPAALAMVAQAAGRPVTPAQLTPQVYLPGRQGALQVEMLAAARRQGLVPYLLAPDLQALLAEVVAGEPVLVLQNLGLSFSPLWHYAVVIGYDRTTQDLILHSGTTARQRMPVSTFEQTWARSGHWALRVTPPARLPATAQPEPWARAVAALERVDASAAYAAWATALQRWPGDRPALLGLGNAAHAMGQRERAAQAFEAATLAQPDFADAWHNLAQVRLELDQLSAAQAAASRAVALGGHRLVTYQALQRQIAQRQAR